MFRSGFWKNRSIKFRILLIFILVNSVMVICFIGTFLGQNLITSEYHRLMQNNIILGELSLKIEQNPFRLFDKFLVEKNEQSLKEFFKLNQEIKSNLSQVEADVQKDDNSAIYHRYLTNMLEKQDQMATKILNHKVFDSTTYQDLTYLKTLNQYMQNQSRQLVVAYLDYSSFRYAELQGELNHFQLWILIIIIALSSATILLALFFTRKIFLSIAQLSKAAKCLAVGDWTIRDLKESKYHDLNLMVVAFNNMKNSIRQYIKEVNQKAELEIQLNREKLDNAEKDRLLKESHLLALQMQMNPHFLFNTLNLIGRMAMFQETEVTIKLIESISKILRYNIQNEGNFVSLEDELKVVQAYFYIQETRFQERIAFSLEVRGDIQQITLPPMIIQPLVENAIVHGLKDIRENGEVEVVVTREKEFVKIAVKDNGSGIEKERQEKLFNEVREENKERKSIGLGNVKKRLELHFGRLNLIRIISEPGKGTTVLVYIPIKEDKLHA